MLGLSLFSVTNYNRKGSQMNRRLEELNLAQGEGDSSNQSLGRPLVKSLEDKMYILTYLFYYIFVLLKCHVCNFKSTVIYMLQV